MIKDKLSNLNRYGNKFHEITDYIHKVNLNELLIGKYIISDKCFVIVNVYKTVPFNNILENHHRYIDLQIVQKGIEQVYFSDVDLLSLSQSYNSEEDFELFNGEDSSLVLREGEFIILYPGEAHKPGVTFNNLSDEVQKIVFKILA